MDEGGESEGRAGMGVVGSPDVATMPPLRVHGAVVSGAQQRQALETLLAELVPLALPTGAGFLREVAVLPDPEVAEYINNQLIAARTGTPGHYMPAAHGPRGMAVPVSHGDALDCFVILTATFVGEIDPACPRRYRTVSTLLEELRHCEIYARTWRRRGYVQPTAALVPAPLLDLHTIANKVFDEYAVNRWRVTQLTTTPLFDEGQGLTTCGLPVYPQLAAQLDGSAVKLRQIADAWRRARFADAETWARLVEWAGREIFVPLAYAAGYWGDGHATRNVLSTPRTSAYYREAIMPHWEAILARFSRAYDDDLATADGALTEAVARLRAFLGERGATIDEATGTVTIDDKRAPWKYR